MGRPRLLDLFCGAGGAAVGYHRAGFDVVGVDIKPQPNYPFEFHREDALLVGPSFGRYVAIHASPPCQLHSQISHRGRAEQRGEHPELIGPTRELLRTIALPWVIENVPGAPLRHDVSLCGEMFGLRLHRHRFFEVDGFFVMQPRHAPHHRQAAEHNCDLRPERTRQITGNYADHEGASEAMGIDWMKRGELNLAIPPAYTEHIGHYLMLEVQARQKRALAGEDDAEQ